MSPTASTAGARPGPERTGEASLGAAADAPAGRTRQVDRLLALRALRARQWAHFALLPASAVAPADLPREWSRLALAVVAAGGALAWAYAINAVADRHGDTPQKNPLAGAARVAREVVVATIAAGALALAAAAALGGTAMALVASSLAAGLAYSAGPRLKGIPVLGLAANTAIFTTLAGLALGGTPSARFWAIVAAFAGLLVQNQLAHELADAREDAAAGAWTTARWLGPARTRAAICVAGVGATALVLATGAPAGARAVAVCGLAAGAWAATRDGAAAARRRHRAISLATGAALWLGMP